MQSRTDMLPLTSRKKAIHTESTDLLSRFREINELLIHSNQKRDIFPFPTDNSTVYHSFKDAVTEKIVSSWKPQEKVFLSADSTKETLDTLIQYFSAYDRTNELSSFLEGNTEHLQKLQNPIRSISS